MQSARVEQTGREADKLWRWVRQTGKLFCLPSSYSSSAFASSACFLALTFFFIFFLSYSPFFLLSSFLLQFTALPLDSTYSELHQSSYLSMSSAKLVVSDDPKHSHIDFLQILCWNSHTPSLEVEEDNKKSREITMEAKGEDRSPAPPPPSSSSSCSSEEIGIKEEKDQGKDAGDAGEDEGYRTPTSPRNRIPEVRRCPPAPRKPPSLLYVKRKVRTSQAGQLVDVEGEIGSFWSAELADAVPRTKKPRREATNA